MGLIQVSIPDEMHKKLRMHKAETGEDIQVSVVTAIQEFLKKPKKK